MTVRKMKADYEVSLTNLVIRLGCQWKSCYQKQQQQQQQKRQPLQNWSPQMATFAKTVINYDCNCKPSLQI